MSEGDETKTTVTGTVEEVLPNSLFRVRLSEQADAPSEASAKEGEPDEQPLILAYLAGKMRLHRIRVLPGDRVSLEMSPDGGRGRINRRL